MKIKQILLQDKTQEKILVQGWVRTIRNQSSFSFCSVNDGSCNESLQVLFSSEYTTDLSQIKMINTGCCISVEGDLVMSPAKGQKYELLAKNLQILGNVDIESYPLSKNRINLETLRKYHHLRARTAAFGSIFRIRNVLSFAMHQFYQKEGFLHLDPNIITVNECEGGAGVFTITENSLNQIDKLPVSQLKESTTNQKLYDWNKDHFGKQAFLTVSSQLNLEAMCCSLGNVYTTNKSFRSEHSSTNKHLSEFVHLEIEMAFNTFQELMDISEKFIHYLVDTVLEKCYDDLMQLDKFISKGITERIKKLKTPFKRSTYRKCIQLLQKAYSKKKIDEEPIMGADLSSQHENYLTQHYKGPVFVTDWPIAIKSFYMKQGEYGTCQSFDLLMPDGVGELIGGSQREDDYQKLLNMMEQKNINPKPLEFYTDLRKFGSCPHGGFGLGFDRLVMLFTGMKNIRDVIPFPISYKTCNY